MRIMIILFLTTLFLHANYNEKGMRVYKKNCKYCHGSGDYAGAKLEQSDWEDYFFLHAKKLKSVHQAMPKVYRRIVKFSPKKLKNLEDFLVGNAKDSGAVGGCDGNRCGIKSGVVPIRKRE